MSNAEAFYLVPVLVPGAFHAFQHLVGDGDLALLTGLAVVDADVALQGRPRFRRVYDVEHVGLELVVAKHVDAVLEPCGVVQIADEHGETASLVLGDEGPQAVLQIRLAFGADVPEKIEDLEDAPLAARGRHACHHRVGAGDDRHTIEIRERDVRERSRQTPSLVELLAVTEAHARRAIDDEVDAEILFLFVHPDEEASEALEHVPVDAAKVVTRRVVAVVGELDAAALLLGTTLGALTTRKYTATHDRERVELLLELVVEEIRLLDAWARQSP
jgi:hypothetical protein